MNRLLTFLIVSLVCVSSGVGQLLTALPPLRIILVGDSTMAAKSGYGPGFCANFAPQVDCLDMAKGGRSSASYRAEGSWAEVMSKLQSSSEFHATYVLIQFGHNDQPGKPGRSTVLATEFPANLRRYVEEVKAAGAKPVLVTPLTRRIFRSGKVKDSLGPWAEAAERVAADERIPLLDLNSESTAAVEAMGATEANTLAMTPPPVVIAVAATRGESPPAPKSLPTSGVERNGTAAPLFDYTHLGSKGSAFFGRMVADELARAVPEVKPYLVAGK